MEERTHHYSSPYNNSSNNWFHTWTNDHNLTTPEYNYSRKVNRDLLSDVNHPIKKEDNEFRIIGLGDSFTEGDGAHKDSTWLKALERIIARNKSQQNHTYMNAGVSGSDVFFEYILLKEKLLKYKPDLVLLALNNSDISDVIIRGGMGRFKSDGTLIFNKAPNWEPIFAVSYLSRFVFKNALKYNDILVKRNSEKYQIARTQIFQALKQIQELALKNNFEFVVVFHPVKDEISKGELDLADVLSRVKKETQIVNFNLLEYFLDMEGINSSNFDQLYWEHDGHHNALGYEKFANGIEWKMKKMNIIQSDSSN
jgi:lysophospholipase L1-like esterase